MTNEEFTRHIMQMGEELYRDMPWREDTRPYYVLVSELMLQQTQVVRVIPKFNEFIAAFPNEGVLARASLADVLRHWQGLGYNRRAKYLYDAAKIIENEYGGKFPTAESDILQLPGVGKNTAGAILAYAFNVPALYIETNVRTVYIHHFFSSVSEVSDKQILEILRQTIDYDNPRRFYQALMDYGSWLKANSVKNTAQSKHYKRQTPLAGSVRQVRGQIITKLSTNSYSRAKLQKLVDADDRFQLALKGLLADGLIEYRDKKYHLTK